MTTPTTVAELRAEIAKGCREAATAYRAEAERGLQGAAQFADRLDEDAQRNDALTGWSVYESDKITRGSAPRNEREVASGFRTPSEAMDHANALARANRAKTYMVGSA